MDDYIKGEPIGKGSAGNIVYRVKNGTDGKVSNTNNVLIFNKSYDTRNTQGSKSQ